MASMWRRTRPPAAFIQSAGYVLIPIRFDAALVEVLEPGELPDDWRRSPPPASTRRLGDSLMARGAPVLGVPSVIVPAECNYVIDPRVLAPGDPDAGRVEVREPEPVSIDPRLTEP